MRSVNQFGLDDPTEEKNLDYYQSIDITTHENGEVDVKIDDTAQKCSNRDDFMKYMQKIYDSSMQLMRDQRSRTIDDRLEENIKYITSQKEYEIEHFESIQTRSVDELIEYLKEIIPKLVMRYRDDAYIAFLDGEGKYIFEKDAVIELTDYQLKNSLHFTRNSFDAEFSAIEGSIRGHILNLLKKFKDPMLICDNRYVKLIESEQNDEFHCIRTDSLTVVMEILKKYTKDYINIYVEKNCQMEFTEGMGYKWVTISRIGNEKNKMQSILYALFCAIKAAYTNPDNFKSFMENSNHFYADCEGSDTIGYKIVIKKEKIEIFKTLLHYSK